MLQLGFLFLAPAPLFQRPLDRRLPESGIYMYRYKLQYIYRVIIKTESWGSAVQTHKNGQDNFLLPLSGANWFTYDVNVDMVSFHFFFLFVFLLLSSAPGLLLLFRWFNGAYMTNEKQTVSRKLAKEELQFGYRFQLEQA